MPLSESGNRVVVVLNPAAGGGRAAGLASGIGARLARAGVEHLVLQTDQPGHATVIASRQRGRSTVVAAAGGDGTVHEVANGLLSVPEEERPALGVLPVGTGNDFAKLLSGRTIDSAVSALAGRGTRIMDVGRVSWQGGTEYFINGMGTGIDVEVVRQIQRMTRFRGVAGYLLGVLRALRVFEPIEMRYRVGAEWSSRRVMIIAVGNGVCQGGGFYLTPDATPDDGRLDLCMVREINLPRIARALTRLMRGRHITLPEVCMERFEVLEIETVDAPLFFQVDGELREPPEVRRLRVEVVPAALRVVTEAAA